MTTTQRTTWLDALPPNRERPTTLVYLLDDTMPRITYRWKP